MSHPYPKSFESQYWIWLFLIFLPSLSYAEDVVVGIFGDIHGNEPAAERALDQMKAKGVNYLIGTGDFIEWGGTRQLDRMLSMFSRRTNVDKNNIYLMPGNWEHETTMLPDTANSILEKYGNLITPDYAGYGYVKIHGKRIMVSHFPQHAIPTEMLPDFHFLHPIRGQEYVLNSIENGIYPDPRSAFEIIAHTHIGGHYTDPVSGKLVINAGTLHPKKKLADEPMAFALYYPYQDKISFFEVGNQNPLETISVGKRRPYPTRGFTINACPHLLHKLAHLQKL